MLHSDLYYEDSILAGTIRQSMCYPKDESISGRMQTMPPQAFTLDCMHCGKKLNCPSADVGRRIRCPACGSAMMADPARKSHDDIELPDLKPEAITEERDDTDL
jgi:DNA-directed RNA polymerase subunit RPC12/RpoP